MSNKPSYIILGGTGGIGSALCRNLKQETSQILVCGRNREKLSALSQALGIETIQTDATKSDQVESCFAKAKELFGEIDGVVNCAGSLLIKPAHLTTEEEWQSTLSVNLSSAFNIVKFATKAMFKSGGSIVLMSSSAARVGIINHEAISAAKAGILGLTLSAAATYAKNEIRVNAVAPGLVRTPLTEHLTVNPTMEQASINMHALGRLGDPEDIANMIAWLLNPRQNWITGQVFGVDGGLATVRPRVKA